MAEVPSQAVFLSYASQDAAAVRRIAGALRAAGVEVWFDQNELVGGDAWDQKIRRQIKECALFVPVISAATQARGEGYFRLEWKLAVDRSHLMAPDQPFLLPVVIDDTPDAAARVADEFRAVQWTRLRPVGFGGQARDDASVAAFCARVRKLLDGEGRDASPRRPLSEAEKTAGRRGETSLPAKASRPWLVPVILGVTTVAGLAIWRPWRETASPRVAPASVSSQPSNPASAPVANDKSLVVLPLENLSPDPENAFFTDGMHAQIITTLQRMTDLRVFGRDTALAFKRGSMTVAEFAQRLGAANVLTGSVHRAGTKARIVLELRRASDDALLWQSPDAPRDLSDTWTVQTEVAEQVARALKARESVGSNAHARYLTKNPQAFDLFVKGSHLFFAGEFARAIPFYAESYAQDSSYVVPAYMLAHAHCNLFYFETDPATRLRYAAEARRWIEVVARLDSSGFGAIAESHYASNVDEDNIRALEQAERGLRALPNENAASTFHAIALEGLGRIAEAFESYHRATQLDPLLVFSLSNEARVLTLLRRESEAWAMLSRMNEATGATRPFDYIAFKMAFQFFRLNGSLPKSIETIPQLQERTLWLLRARRFAEAERAATGAANQAGISDVARFEALALRHHALLRLDRWADAETTASALLELARKLQGVTEVGPPRKDGWLAVAEARAGHAEAAISAARRFVEDAAPGRQQAIRWQREIAFAELYAYLNRPRECVELLAKLLRVPSGLTVPMLTVDPAWDNVREDPAFKALLADPKNSAPL